MSTAVQPANTALGEPGRYLTFRLDREVYGVPILNVREIIEMQEISPVPRAAPSVRGVVNLRGRVLPVIDPKIRFGLDPVEPSELTVIIVLQPGDSKPFGVLVDEVLEVHRFDADAITDAPAGASDQQDALAAFGKVRDQLVFLLDPTSLGPQ
ncbi:MAG: chemotaxis protein CheW [Myxococcota bacterium]